MKEDKKKRKREIQYRKLLNIQQIFNVHNFDCQTCILFFHFLSSFLDVEPHRIVAI